MPALLPGAADVSARLSKRHQGRKQKRCNFVDSCFHDSFPFCPHLWKRICLSTTSGAWFQRQAYTPFGAGNVYAVNRFCNKKRQRINSTAGKKTQKRHAADSQRLLLTLPPKVIAKRTSRSPDLTSSGTPAFPGCSQWHHWRPSVLQ